LTEISLKTSLLFHYGYLIIDHLGNSETIKTENEEVVHGVILCKQVYAILLLNLRNRQPKQAGAK